MVEIACSENDGCGVDNELGNLTVSGLTPGVTYYIQFSSWSTADRGSYTIELDCDCVVPESILPETVPLVKNRYLSFDPSAINSINLNVALRVQLKQLDGFGEFNNQVRWVGPPNEYQELVDPVSPFIAAQLQCQPHYQNWTGIDLLHVYGDAIVPGSDYELQTIFEFCNINNELGYSNALTVSTGTWGDIIAPFEGEGVAQPNIADVLSLVDKWLGNLEPLKTRSQLQPNIPNPSQRVSIADILKGVDAWLGTPYPFAGPTACP